MQKKSLYGFCFISIFILSVVTGVYLSNLSHQLTKTFVDPLELEVRGEININSDAALSAFITANPTHCSGSGTAADPYIIRNYNLASSNIYLSNTQLHVILENIRCNNINLWTVANCRIINCDTISFVYGLTISTSNNVSIRQLSTQAKYGIRCYDSDQIALRTITSYTTEVDSIGLSIDGCQAIYVYDFQTESVAGISITNSNTTILTNIQVKASNNYGMYIKNIHDITMKNIKVTSTFLGMNLIHLQDIAGFAKIENATLIGGENGFYIKGVTGLQIENSTVSSASQYGLRILYSPYPLIDNITVQNCFFGAIFDKYSSYALIQNSNFTTNGRYGLQYNGNNARINNNIFEYNDGEGLVCTETSTNINLTLNIFIENNEIMGYGNQAKDNGGNNRWTIDNIGNYWDDYRLRYPTATFDAGFWNEPYSINGSANSKDVKSPIYNYAFTMNHPNDISYEFTWIADTYNQYTIEWMITRKATVDIDWELYAMLDLPGYIHGPYPDLNGVLSSDDESILSFSPNNLGQDFIINDESVRILPIGRHNFTLRLIYESIIIEDTIYVQVENIAPRIAISDPLLYDQADGTNKIIQFTVTDSSYTNIDFLSYTVYRNGFVVQGYEGTLKKWLPDEIVTIDVSNLLYGTYLYEIHVTDGKSTTTASVGVTVSPDTINYDPIIRRIDDIAYKLDTIQNLIRILITDTRVANPVYAFYIDDDVYDLGTWTSGSEFFINIDGLSEGTHLAKLIAKDGVPIVTSGKSQGETEIIFNINVYIGDNPPPIIIHIDDITTTTLENKIVLSWKIIDPVVFLPSYDIQINGEQLAFGIWISDANITTLIDDTRLTTGQNNVTLIVNDGLGKTAESIIHIIIVDRPNLTWLYYTIVIGSIGGCIITFIIYARRKCLPDVESGLCTIAEKLQLIKK